MIVYKMSMNNNNNTSTIIIIIIVIIRQFIVLRLKYFVYSLITQFTLYMGYELSRPQLSGVAYGFSVSQGNAWINYSPLYLVKL
jgi:hypothetical protein